MTNLYLISINGSEYAIMPYGRTDSYLIEATSKDEARKITHKNDKNNLYGDCWLDSNRADCETIKETGHSRVITQFSNMDA